MVFNYLLIRLCALCESIDVALYFILVEMSVEFKSVKYHEIFDGFLKQYVPLTLSEYRARLLIKIQEKIDRPQICWEELISVSHSKDDKSDLEITASAILILNEIIPEKMNRKKTKRNSMSRKNGNGDHLTVHRGVSARASEGNGENRNSSRKTAAQCSDSGGDDDEDQRGDGSRDGDGKINGNDHGDNEEDDNANSLTGMKRGKRDRSDSEDEANSTNENQDSDHGQSSSDSSIASSDDGILDPSDSPTAQLQNPDQIPRKIGPNTLIIASILIFRVSILIVSPYYDSSICQLSCPYTLNTSFLLLPIHNSQTLHRSHLSLPHTLPSSSDDISPPTSSQAFPYSCGDMLTEFLYWTTRKMLSRALSPQQ